MSGIDRTVIPTVAAPKALEFPAPERATLSNGLRVITERMPGIRSAAIGCWVDTGTRDELGNEAGASHFLEHLLLAQPTTTHRPTRKRRDALDPIESVPDSLLA